jgi:nucleoside-diphosphate kinase
MATERTLVLCKPDAVQRGLVGSVIARFERKGLKIAGLKMMRLDEEQADRHYAEHLAKGFYSNLRGFITSSPIVAMAVEGESAVEVVRALIGATNPQAAAAGTIRGDFGLDLTMNLVHGSDSLASAERELALFFSREELHDYELTMKDWT